MVQRDRLDQAEQSVMVIHSPIDIRRFNTLACSKQSYTILLEILITVFHVWLVIEFRRMDQDVIRSPE